MAIIFHLNLHREWFAAIVAKTKRIVYRLPYFTLAEAFRFAVADLVSIKTHQP